MDGISTGEPHLARDLNGPRLDPLRNWFDDQDVIGLQPQIRARIAAADRREIHRNRLGSPRIAVDHDIPGDLGLTAKCRILQAAARADQIADVHRRLERVMSGRLDPAVDADDLLGSFRRRL